MADTLMTRLADAAGDFTPAEKVIANYIRSNREAIAFETATSLAGKLAVSAVTVGRFCRRIGYRHFRELKDDLKMDVSGVPWLVGEQLQRFVDRSKDQGDFRRSLELDVSGIVEVYTMCETPEWHAIVELLAHRSQIHVCGFQTERAIARLLTDFLQYLRPGVHLTDASLGNYADVLLDAPEAALLVVIDTRRYSKHSLMLAQKAKQLGLDCVVITDKYCDWATDLTPHVIRVSTDSHLFWNSEVSLACAVNLLANSVIVELGAAAEPRLEKFSDLYQEFTGHVGRSVRPGTSARSR